MSREEQEVRLVEGVLEGLNPGQAALQAGYHTERQGYGAIKKPRVRELLTSALDRKGLDEGLIAKKLKDGLRATKGIYYQGEHVVDEIDHVARAKYLDMLIDLRGYKAKEEEGDTSWEEAVFTIRARRTSHPGGGG
jgi:hypothetical protein